MEADGVPVSGKDKMDKAYINYAVTGRMMEKKKPFHIQVFTKRKK